MINPNLDINKLKQEFSQNKIIVIDDFFNRE